jgi:hypothetical protein
VALDGTPLKYPLSLPVSHYGTQEHQKRRGRPGWVVCVEWGARVCARALEATRVTPGLGFSPRGSPSVKGGMPTRGLPGVSFPLSPSALLPMLQPELTLPPPCFPRRLEASVVPLREDIYSPSQKVPELVAPLPGYLIGTRRGGPELPSPPREHAMWCSRRAVALQTGKVVSASTLFFPRPPGQRPVSHGGARSPRQKRALGAMKDI